MAGSSMGTMQHFSGGALQGERAVSPAVPTPWEPSEMSGTKVQLAPLEYFGREQSHPGEMDGKLVARIITKKYQP